MYQPNNYYPPPYLNTPQYQRLMQLEAQQQQQQQMQNYAAMPQQMPAMNQFLKGRPVVSLEEARAAQIDLDGSLFVFTDIGNKKIYTKQINLDGTATLNIYTLDNPSSQNQAAYITKEEFDATIKNIKQEMQNQLITTLNEMTALNPQKEQEKGKVAKQLF